VTLKHKTETNSEISDMQKSEISVGKGIQCFTLDESSVELKLLLVKVGDLKGRVIENLDGQIVLYFIPYPQ
jgi:hypothetical protein